MKNKTRNDVVEKMMGEIFKEDDHEKRFQLIQQLELFTRALQGLDVIRE